MPAATATSRRAEPSAAALAKRRDIADKLLKLHVKLAPQFAEMAELEADLKLAAKEAGGSFKEDFGKRGYVSASAAHGAEFKGNVPLVQTEVWLALKPADRKKHEKSGLIKITPQFGRSSNGRVTVKAL